jgi:hypothetical protein
MEKWKREGPVVQDFSSKKQRGGEFKRIFYVVSFPLLVDLFGFCRTYGKIQIKTVIISLWALKV